MKEEKKKYFSAFLDLNMYPFSFQKEHSVVGKRQFACVGRTVDYT